MRSCVLFTGVLVASFTAVVAVADTAGSGNEVFQRYEWRASTYEPSAQHEATVAVDRDGRIITVWSSRRQNGGMSGVYAQRFDARGVALGRETAVSLWPAAQQSEPTVGVDALGHTWIVWQAFGQDGQAGSIIARRFDATFAGSSEIAVNQEVRGHQSQPVLAASPDGPVMIVWTSQGGPRDPGQVRGRIFAASGAPLTDEFAVSAAEGRAELTPSVAAGRDGSFAVAFSLFDSKLDPAGIRIQRISPSGERLGDELAVCGPERQSQIEPVIAATPSGYVVAWLDAESDGDEYAVLARRLDLAGQPVSAPCVVNTTWRGTQSGPAIAVAADGSFVVAYNSEDADRGGIAAQRFAADGTPRGGEFQLTRATQGRQNLRAAASTQRLVYGAHGELICVWNGDAGLGDENSANVTLLTAAPLALAGMVQGVTDEMPVAGPALAAAGGPEPHRPPTFDPNMIDTSPREIRTGTDEPFGFTAINSTGWTPPDPHMAVGPEHIVVMTNGAIAFFLKDGTLEFQQIIEGSSGFWGAQGATGFVFDPEVVYDELSGRFVAMAAEAYAPPNQTKSYVLVAVSDDSNPNGTWYKYRFDTTTLAGNLFDSPNIGVDASVVYVTGDGFGITANYPVYTFDKASLLAGQPPAVQRSTTLSTSTQSAGIPPVSFDAPPAYYLLEHQEGSSRTQVRLIALRNPLTTPTFTTFNLTVPTYSAPGDPVQKGTSIRPETFDARFWSVAYRNGYLWGTHHVNSSPVQARWYQIAMNGWPTSGQNPALVQTGIMNPGTGIHTFFTSITVNARGDAAMTFARSSPNEYISMNTTWRWVHDPNNTFQPITIEKENTGPYSGDRWGDYSAVEADPANIMWFWAHHEYAVGSTWKTWVARISLPWVTGDMNCDGLVNFDDINPFVLALTGQAAYEAEYPYCNWWVGDCNFDGFVDFDDVNCFVSLIGG
jgi:hypothetical protein